MTENIKIIVRTSDFAWFSFIDMPNSIYYGVYNYKKHTIEVMRRQPNCWCDYSTALITEHGIVYNELPCSCKFIKRCDDNYAYINSFFAIDR